LLTPPARMNCQQIGFSSFWTFSRQMVWVCAEPSRFRTSDNSDERFHVQRDVRHARTSHRTSRNDTGKSAWHFSNANPARRAGQMLPAMSGSVLAHSSAGNARVRISPSAQRSALSAQRTLPQATPAPRLWPGDCTSQPTGIGGVLLVATGRTRPTAAVRPDVAPRAASKAQRSFVPSSRPAVDRPLRSFAQDRFLCFANDRFEVTSMPEVDPLQCHAPDLRWSGLRLKIVIATALGQTSPASRSAHDA
jgi:hypothetical protein